MLSDDKTIDRGTAYDTWFREQVQASIDDPRPSRSDDQARAQMARRRLALLKHAGSKPAACEPVGRTAC